jgi:hypothetical protein
MTFLNHPESLFVGDFVRLQLHPKTSSGIAIGIPAKSLILTSSSAKHDSSMTSTEAGSSIDASPLFENARVSIRDNFESDSNLMNSSDSQSEKQDSRMTKTDRGRSNDLSQLPENAFFLSRDNFDPDPNEIDPSD